MMCCFVAEVWGCWNGVVFGWLLRVFCFTVAVLVTVVLCGCDVVQL